MRRLAYLLIAIGVLVLGWAPYKVLSSDASARAAQRHLAQGFKAESSPSATSAQSAPVTTTAPVADAIPNPRADIQAQPLLGGVLDHLVIPVLGLSRYVVQGTAEQDLEQGPGHYLGTPLPGHYGNVGIAGHRTTYGAPFWNLNELTPGDGILFTEPSGVTYTYRVISEFVVLPSNTAVLDPMNGYYLTLTTCNPRFWATSRLVVRAEEISPVQG
jgi:sortase A